MMTKEVKTSKIMHFDKLNVTIVIKLASKIITLNGLINTKTMK